MQRTNNDRDINLKQQVTSEPKTKDLIFVDFDKNWRKFISPSAELALPVVPIRTEVVWEPIVTGECVFSTDAGGFVPQVTLIWNEPVRQAPAPGIAAGQINRSDQPQQQSNAELSNLRFDLAVHYQGFERNFYSSALPTEKLKRFNLPSNSDLINNPEAVVLTGPSLFPRLMDYRTEVVKERNTNRELERQTLVLADLTEGLSYKIRLSNLGEKRWNENRQTVFMTPICPESF